MSGDPLATIRQSLYPSRAPKRRHPDDIAIKNASAGSYLKLETNGDIRMTTRTGALLLMEGSRGSMLLSAKYLNCTAEYMNLRTRPDGLRWNGWALNPELYAWNDATLPDGTRMTDLRLNATVLENGVAKSVRIPMFLPVEQDVELDELLAREGIYDPSEG